MSEPTKEELITDIIYDVLRGGGYTTRGDAVDAADKIYDAIWEYVKEDL